LTGGATIALGVSTFAGEATASVRGVGSYF
jgi:hypothetical protein